MNVHIMHDIPSNMGISKTMIDMNDTNNDSDSIGDTMIVHICVCD